MTLQRLIKTLPLLITTAITSQNVVAKDIELLNVSYDPTRELYQAFNPLFVQY